EKVDKLNKAPEKYNHIGNGFDRGFSGRDSFSLSKIKTFRNEISIRQLTIEEARPVLEKYLDDAYLLGVSPVYIITFQILSSENCVILLILFYAIR
ncbi:unnamed protein product, partial [marine sediment metagenome]